MLDDCLSEWLRNVERDLDPAARMLHFVQQEVPTASQVDPWQLEALNSRASTLALRVCRQAGKSCVLATMGVEDIAAGGTTIALCPAERQVRELVRKVSLYLRATDLVVERATQSEIEVNTGGRFIAVPASSATIRGYTATQILVDECAYIANDEDVIVAVLPMLSDRPNARVVYASTPAGKNNFFARLFLEPKDSVHRIVVPGTSIPRLAPRVERLRQQLSATRFRQEVECEMLSDGLSYFDLSIIANATSQESAICPVL